MQITQTLSQGPAIQTAGCVSTDKMVSGVPRGGVGVWGVQTPPHEIPKALQNHAKLNPICEN